jgi:Sec-independent protein translocase protein TatA
MTAVSLWEFGWLQIGLILLLIVLVVVFLVLRKKAQQ